MSASATDAGTLEVADLEDLFKEAVPCEYETCDKDAEWRVTAIPCGHACNECTYHKLRDMKRFEMDYPDTRCHLSNVPVTRLDAQPL